MRVRERLGTLMMKPPGVERPGEEPAEVMGVGQFTSKEQSIVGLGQSYTRDTTSLSQYGPGGYYAGDQSHHIFGLSNLGQEGPPSWLLPVLAVAGGAALLGLVLCMASKRGTRGGGGMAGLGITKQGREFISKKIATLIREGRPPKQSIRIAYEMARKRGYKVPAAPK